MPSLLEALGSSALAEWLRFSRWAYAAVNATHILGIALLVGAIVPLDLRLLGVWRSVPLRPLERVLVPMAAIGLGIAVAAGALLFLARPARYAALDIFLAKMTLVALGTVNAMRLRLGPALADLPPTQMRLAGLVSLACWLAALALGRLIAFVDP